MESGFWKKLKRPIMVIAPMSGVTDDAFRQMFLKYGPPSVFWTEFVSADGLFSRGREYCLKLLEYSKKPDKSTSRILTGPSKSRQKASLVGERPIVAQLFGSDPVNFEKAAKLVVELGFDGIDINMGCPDNNIEKKGGGAALIKNFALAKEIIRATKKGAGKIPVSVKTRIGYKKNQVSEWIPVILQENVAVLTVHFRTRDEMYYSRANWGLAKEIVKLRDKYSPETLIIGNGDVKSLEQAHKLIKETGVDGVMFGRGILGNPWFFFDKIPSVKERLKAIVKHAEIFDSFHKEDIRKNGHYKKFESLKKHFHAYTKGFDGAKELREQLMKVKNTSQVKKTIKDFLEKKTPAS
ncbi:MAG: tRNA-dihydrouridine synthase [Candidatus Staskawiczbacteria bacterium]|nr:tRNA-dihydrouridine synthase [Candidatus Staskawiczbacteria bacterium]